MTALLSLFLSFAMLFTGGALPATADTASTLTVQNIELSYEGESYPLGVDFSLTGAAGQDEIILHFEALSDGETLLPVSGKINENGAAFTIAEAGSVFTVSAETLNEMLGLEESDASAFEAMAGMIASYAQMLAKAQDYSKMEIDPETQAAMMEILYAQMQDVAREEVAYDFGGGEIPAQKVSGTLSGTGVFAAMDGWMAMDNEVVSSMLQYILDVYNMVFTMAASGEMSIDTDAASIGVIGGADGPTSVFIAGEKAETFTELITNLAGEETAVLEAFSMPMSIVTAQADGTEYVAVEAEMNIADEASMEIFAEGASSAEQTILHYELAMDQEYGHTSCSVEMAIEGPATAPEFMDTVIMMQSGNDFVVEETGETVHTGNAALVAMSAAYDEGLMDMELQMEVANSYTEDGEAEEGDDAFTMSLTVDQEQLEEGVFSDINILAAPPEQESFGLRFETLLSKGATPDYFAGRSVVELPADDSEDPAYDSLSVDAMALMADAMTIAANEDFMRFTELFTADLEPEETSEETTEEVQYLSFASLEEAAGTFTGEIPAYTPPEGYSLQTVTATPDGSYLYAEYASDEGSAFSLEIYEYGYPSDTKPYILSEGTLNAVDAPLFNLSGEEGAYYSAAMDLPSGNLYVYFGDDADFAFVQSVLAGLK